MEKKTPLRQSSRPSDRETLQKQCPEDQLLLKDRALAVAAEGITIADARLPDNPLIYVNEGFEQLTGYSAEDVIGLNCRFLQGSDPSPDAVEEIRAARREGRDCVVEILNYRKTGEPFWNRLSITPVRDETGEITHYIGIQSDVTARREAEEALSETKTKLEIANKQMKRDLEMAARIQRALLPTGIPKLEGVRVSWTLESCTELAGDTLDVIRLDDHRVAVYVLDVSGHGVPAALLSVTLNHWLTRRFGESELTPGEREQRLQIMASPAQVAEQLNKDFPIDPDTSQYFTLLYGVLNTATQEFHYVTAGHPSLIHVPRDTDPIVEPAHSFPIGVVAEPDYEASVLRLAPGDRLYLYSDGIIEAENGEKEEFGTSGLVDQLHRCQDRSIEESISQTIERVREWRGGRPIDDDISLLALEIE